MTRDGKYLTSLYKAFRMAFMSIDADLVHGAEQLAGGSE
jgi:hypothetical protein